MKKMRILWQVIKQTRSDEIILSYLMFVFIDALVIFLVDRLLNLMAMPCGIVVWLFLL